MILMRRSSRGFSLIEILIVVAILGILATLILVGVRRGQLKARDNAIRNDIRQLRWLAEQVYDSQAASYVNWSDHASIQEQLTTLLEDIDEQTLTSNSTTIRDSQAKEYCTSAPLRSDPAQHYCIDATGIFRTVSQACADQALNGPPLRCPSS